MLGQSLTEKIEVNVVNVDVTVLDHGRPVHGLSADDFEIFEDGLPQKITNFYAVESDGAGVSKAVEPEPQRFRRKVLVIIDNYHTTRWRRDLALANLQKFIGSNFDGGYEWSIATIDHQPRLVLPLTSDRQKIDLALDAIRRHGPRKNIELPFPVEQSLGTGSGMIVAPSDANMDNSCFGRFTDTLEGQMIAVHTLDSILEASRAFAKSEGKKVIILITGEIPLPDVSVTSPQYVSEVSVMQAESMQFRDLLIREANASNVNFYVVNTEGLHVRGWDKWGDIDTSAMYWLSRETGGRYFPGNYVDRSLLRFDSISSNFYSLGYSPQHPEDSRYHTISVRVKSHPSYFLQHRDGYSNVNGETQLDRALRSSIGVSMLHSTVPVQVTFDSAIDRRGLFEVPIHVAVDASQLIGPVDVFVSLFDAEGRHLLIMRGRSQIAEGRFTATESLPLRRGSYQVVVAVHDPLSDALGVSVRKITAGSAAASADSD